MQMTSAGPVRSNSSHTNGAGQHSGGVYVAQRVPLSGAPVAEHRVVSSESPGEERRG